MKLSDEQKKEAQGLVSLLTLMRMATATENPISDELLAVGVYDIVQDHWDNPYEAVTMVAAFGIGLIDMFESTVEGFGLPRPDYLAEAAKSAIEGEI